jgi:putative FmdB family regulatory protein
MPTYEYECPACAHRFEKFQGINDAPVKMCPQCGGEEVRRLMGTGAGIIVKGSGSSASAAHAIKCGKEQTCCGRGERCEKPPCS